MNIIGSTLYSVQVPRLNRQCRKLTGIGISVCSILQDSNLKYKATFKRLNVGTRKTDALNANFSMSNDTCFHRTFPKNVGGL